MEVEESGAELENAGKVEAEAEYHSHDFDWEDLKAKVESDPAFSYHLSPFSSPAAGTTSPPQPSSEAWKSFHRRHASGKFFKERRYLLKEFPELPNSKDCAKILEVGCGNGSTAVSILRSSESITVFACDCSKDTLEKANEIISNTKGIDIKDRFHPFLMDVSKETFPDWLFCNAYPSHHKVRKEQPDFLRENQCCVSGMDFVTMIFTLSAIPFTIMPSTIEQCVSVLKPRGLLLFRDYGLYDMTMLRFLPHQRVGFREYMRTDGTLSYFFTLDTVRELFHAAGLIEVALKFFNMFSGISITYVVYTPFLIQVHKLLTADLHLPTALQLELEYCCVQSVNRKNGKKMQRVWVHGKFQKPAS
ncbi:Methyltransferase-like protein [Dichanthelium oligosanthes]|uniref:tRNA N(3)-methylcytidine methyltransferase n=1 Tax=Dichanthelium oligosanthes TaxID=888268 RepID=A0A1E5V5Z6_9POAL|nr:Methyltransferase-like protein [Dichanthelium oligosanthes]